MGEAAILPGTGRYRPQSGWWRGRGDGLQTPSYNDQRDLERLPAEIDRLQSEIDRTEHELHDSGLYGRDPRRFIELTERAAKLRAEKEAAELRWLEVAELAEQLQRQAG